MNKKGVSTAIVIIVALVLGLLVLLFSTNLNQKIADLLKISRSYAEFDTNNKEKEIVKTQTEYQIEGKISAFIVKKEDNFNIKPTSPDHCLVGALIINTGKKTWEDSDKIKMTLFCKYEKGQKDLPIQNYPDEGYVKDLKPNQQITVFFNKEFPNNCIESFEKYQIILYSNCEGIGTNNKPCDNFGTDPSKNPKILNLVEFNCKIS